MSAPTACVSPRSPCVDREVACVEMLDDRLLLIYPRSAPPALMAFQQAASRCMGAPTIREESDEDAARNLLGVSRDGLATRHICGRLGTKLSQPGGAHCHSFLCWQHHRRA